MTAQHSTPVDDSNQSFDFDSLSSSELKVIEDLFMQGITGKPASVSKRVAMGLTAKGIVEETVIVTGYKPTGAVTKAAFRLSAMGHYRYCTWFDRKSNSTAM